MMRMSILSALPAILVLSTLSAVTIDLPALAQDPQALFGNSAAPAKAMPAKAAPAKAVPAKSTTTKSATPKPARTGQTGRRPAAPSARPSSRGDAGPTVSASPAAIRAYCTKLWGKVQNNWDLAVGKNHVVLSVDLDGSGNVVGTTASSQPKSAEAESKAQQALTKSQPLDPLPSGLPSARLTITFDSTADAHGDSSYGGNVSLRYEPLPTSSSAPAAAPGGGDSDNAAAPAATTPAQ